MNTDFLKQIQSELREKTRVLSDQKEILVNINQRKENMESELLKTKSEKERLFMEKENAFNAYAQGTIKENVLRKTKIAYENIFEKERDIQRALDELSEERNKISALINNLQSDSIQPITKQIWQIAFDDIKADIYETIMSRVEAAYVSYMKTSTYLHPTPRQFASYILTDLWGTSSHSGPSQERLNTVNEELGKRYGLIE